MSIQLPSLTDPEVLVDVPASNLGGRYLLMTRAQTKADADAAAVAAGLLVEVETDQGARLVSPRDGRQPTVSRVEVGSVVITPGTYDEEGNELTAPVIDTRHHDNWIVDARQMSEEYGRPLVEVQLLAWVAAGEEGAANNTETAIALGNVELIDPDSISSWSVRL